MRLDQWKVPGLALMYVGALGCAGNATPVTPPAPPAPTAILLEVNATPDSVVRLAQFAIGAIEGLPQLPKTRPEYTSVSTHYTRAKKGGGTTQVAVIVAVDRVTPGRLAGQATRVEVSAWLLDVARYMAPQPRRTSDIPRTAVTMDAPALQRPRPATARDTTDWASLEYVVEVFVRHGARRLP
jgi:hypothetical protein